MTTRRLLVVLGSSALAVAAPVALPGSSQAAPTAPSPHPHAPAVNGEQVLTDAQRRAEVHSHMSAAERAKLAREIRIPPKGLIPSTLPLIAKASGPTPHGG